MSKRTPEELEELARQVTGREPLTLDELADELLDSYYRDAREMRWMEAIEYLIEHDQDCSDASVIALIRERWLEHLQARYDAGDNRAILDTVQYCAEESLVMPNWAAAAFCEKYRRIVSLEAKTLDEAFEVSPEKHGKFDSMRKRLKMGVLVYYDVISQSKQGDPVDEGLFEKVGESLGLTMSTTRRYFYWFKNTNHHIVAIARPQIEKTLSVIHDLPKSFMAAKVGLSTAARKRKLSEK